MPTLFVLVIGGIIMFVGPEDNSIFKVRWVKMPLGGNLYFL